MSATDEQVEALARKYWVIAYGAMGLQWENHPPMHGCYERIARDVIARCGYVYDAAFAEGMAQYACPTREPDSEAEREKARKHHIAHALEGE